MSVPAKSIGVWGRGRLALSVSLVSAVALLGAASGSAQTGRAEVAVAVSVTGVNATYGAPALEGARMAIEEANAAGASPQIALGVYDDGSDLERGKAIATELVAGDTLVVIGPATTPMALATGPVYAAGGLAAIGTTATGDGVTDSATIFRASFSTSEGGEALANYLALVLGGKRAAVIYKDDGYGQPFAAGFRRAAERLGITATYHPFATTIEAVDKARLVAADPDAPAVVLGMIGDFVPVLTTLRRRNARGLILGTNAIAGDYFAKTFADQPEEQERPGYFADGVYAAAPLLFDSANAETLAFAERYRTRFGQEPSYISVQGYEAARLAIAAVRAEATKRDQATDIKARRAAIGAYLASLDGPAHAVPGLNGPLWFTPGRGREQALRIGRFHGTRFESAPTQLVPVRDPDPREIAAGTVVDIGGRRFARRQGVVYTGMYLNEIARVDVAQSTFTADFYLWMRFARGSEGDLADPTDIEFPNLVRGSFDKGRLAAARELDDGTSYRLWQVRGDFKNDFDLRRYPGDRQYLSVRLFNSRVASDRLVYVLDSRFLDAGADLQAAPRSAPVAGAAAAAPADAMSEGSAAATAVGLGIAPEAFRNLTQWTAQSAVQRRDSLVTASALGDPRLVGLERIRELSGFNLTIELRRRMLATLAKTLLPLGLMTLIMYAALNFPATLVKEKVTVAITGALSGAVLLSAINAQLGNVGYVIAIEYGFYVFFVLCLVSIVAVLLAERFRAVGRASAAGTVERSGRLLFLSGVIATVAVASVFFGRWQPT